MLKLIFRWGPTLLILSFLFFMSSQAKGSALVPDFGGWRDLLLKKGAHFACYALLAVSWVHGLRGNRPARRMDYVYALLFTVLYAVSDEYHQTFVQGREGRWQDVLIDTTGASIALCVRYGWNAWTRGAARSIRARATSPAQR